MFNNYRYFILFFIVFNLSLAVYLIHFWGHYNELQSIKSDEFLFKSEDVFVPTDEWQPLKKDQPIPQGLHVRINLQTGYREAKLLSAEKKTNEDTSVTLTSTGKNSENPEKLEYAYVKEALKNIPNEIKFDSKEDTEKKFRTYEELKKDMSDLKLNIKTDFEVINELITEFNNLYNNKKVGTEEKSKLIQVMRDLEFLLHQGDNAKEFAKQNGITSIIMPTLMSNYTTLRILGAEALGAAVQNNGKVQVAALKAGIIPALLRNIALGKDFKLRSSSLYALSCLIRSFPLAEIKLFEEGGLSVLFSLFDESSDDSLKLQLKVVTLFSDLEIEKADAELTKKEKEILNQNITEEIPNEEFKQISEKLRQYNDVGLSATLIEHSWCAKLSKLILNRSFKIGNIDYKDILNLKEKDVNHEVVETVVDAALPIMNDFKCQKQFLSQSKITSILPNILTYYKELASKESEDKFYSEIFNKLNTLCILLKLK